MSRNLDPEKAPLLKVKKFAAGGSNKHVTFHSSSTTVAAHSKLQCQGLFML